ncbi:sugar porter family MFS transporter [Lyngbya sp. PCC 8106]|uniref:sugar porter family MFS transporter n=1 Tax=Lyngbya sp. (strain PCC 8106) TaxID=313612 RepID=UPI0000EADAAE|nr:sugar porter family MFS transporter [Lyngbya sp. PCC 8106]EAW36347.1 glucose transport protein [Lyngbya sp. PCC 8106]
MTSQPQPENLVTSNPSTTFVILIAGVAALGGFLFGFDTAVINGAVIALQNFFNATSLQIGLAVSLALLGSAVGAFLAGSIADRYGRSKAMIVASLMFTLSAIGSGVPLNLWVFIGWRLLGGFAVGVASVIAPAYIAEISPAHLRGRLGSLQQLAIVTGIFMALLTNFLIVSFSGSADNPFLFGLDAWRWMFWAEIIPAVLYGVGALKIPESPRYLVAQGQEAEAATVLEKVIGGDVQAKITEIRSTIRREHKSQLSDLISRGGGLISIVWIGIGLSVFQQFVGINVIFYYSSVLWRSVGFTEADSLSITVITGVTNIITTLVAIAFIDKFGRKPLLLLGSVGMTITLGTMAVLFSNATVNASGEPTLTGLAGIAALIAANLYVFCYGFSWGPVVWVMLGEMFNNQIRGIALAVAASVQWVANFMISTTFPPLLAQFGLGTAYGLYTTAAAISFFFVWFFIRETKGLELEQM